MLDIRVVITAILCITALQIVAIIYKEDGAYLIAVVGVIGVLAGAKIGDLAAIFMEVRKNGKSVDNNSLTGD